jgi:hypothetical protein
MASHSNTKRQRTAASRFHNKPALDAQTVTSLAAAALPGYSMSVQNLAVISVMLQQTASAARRKLQAAKIPNRDTMVAFWILEGQLTGDVRFVENRSDNFVSDPSIDLEEIDLDWIQEHVPRAWTEDSHLMCFFLMDILVMAAISRYQELESLEIELNRTMESFPRTWEGVYQTKEMLLAKIDTNSDTDDESSEIQESDSE